MFFISLGDKHIGWATIIQNGSWKDAEPLKFSTIIAQQLDKSRILAKSSARTDITLALIGKQFDKQNFSCKISSNLGQSKSNQVSAAKPNLKKADTMKQQPSIYIAINLFM